MGLHFYLHLVDQFIIYILIYLVIFTFVFFSNLRTGCSPPKGIKEIEITQPVDPVVERSAYCTLIQAMISDFLWCGLRVLFIYLWVRWLPEVTPTHECKFNVNLISLIANHEANVFTSNLFGIQNDPISRLADGA